MNNHVNDTTFSTATDGVSPKRGKIKMNNDGDVDSAVTSE